MGIEVPGGQTKGSSGASNASLNQNILSKLIKEKSIAIMSMEQKAEIEQAVKQEFGFNDDDDFY